MHKFPAASRTLAWLSTRLSDENSSGLSRDSSTDLLQMDETEGDMVNCRPSSLAMLLAYIISKFPIAPKPLAQPFISSGLRALYRSPLGGLLISPGLTMFNSPVNPLSRSLSRDSVRGNRYPRLCPRSQDHEGISFALPGMGTQSHLPMIRLTELHTCGCHICPDVK